MKIIEYPKINTIWKRDPETHKIIEGQYSEDEFSAINRWLVTEKIDGMNIRVIWNGEDVEFRGRTDAAQLPPELLKYLTLTFNKPTMQKTFSYPVILFGEGYGNKIQKVGHLYSDKQKFILFDVWQGDYFFDWHIVKDITDALGIDTVHSFGVLDTEFIIENIIKDEFSERDATSPFEGVVCRSYPTLFNKYHNRIIWKLKVKDYQ